MAKAAVCVNGCGQAINGAINVAYGVSVDTGLNFGADFTLNFAASTVQMLNDLKDSVIQTVTGLGGPALARADITVFGGPN